VESPIDCNGGRTNGLVDTSLTDDDVDTAEVDESSESSSPEVDDSTALCRDADTEWVNARRNVGGDAKLVLARGERGWKGGFQIGCNVEEPDDDDAVDEDVFGVVGDKGAGDNRLPVPRVDHLEAIVDELDEVDEVDEVAEGAVMRDNDEGSPTGVAVIVGAIDVVGTLDRVNGAVVSVVGAGKLVESTAVGTTTTR
jgi:hypothetical protein